MALAKTGQGITDIKGKFGGTSFTRDKSGLHQSAQPRKIRRCTAAQAKQRKAFAKARAYSTDPRTVSYLIYRALNNLPFLFDAFVTGSPTPDCTGKYVLAGEHNGEDYYERTDSAWAIWYHEGYGWWFITAAVGVLSVPYWLNREKMEGIYTPVPPIGGNPVVKLTVQPPPADYSPPGL